MMTEVLASNYISIQLLEFLKSDRCCRKLCGSFRNQERAYIMQYALYLRLRTRFFVCNGIKTVLIYKDNCFHQLESTTCIQLQQRTKKELFYLHEDSCFIGTQREMQISADYFIPGNIRPFVQPHRFSLGPLKQSMARKNYHGQQSYQKSCLLTPYKHKIIQSIHKNKVVFISGDTILEKSVAIPMFLMEHSAAHAIHCKIICVESDQLLAVYNSEILSNCLGEKVGDTVAFQVHLQSRISETSNLIYTTASFLLRVLMGQKIVDSFRHISHVIINEVQLHEALSDILLCELREAIKFHANLKVVMLSSSAKQNTEFISYFGEGEELFFDYSLQPVNTLYLDDINEIICKERSSYPRSYAYSSPPTVEYINQNIHSQVDKTLEEYNHFGTDKTLKAFLYFVQSEFISVDYKHSVNGYNALNIAIKFGHADHVQELLHLKADPFLLNEQQLKFLTNSVSQESTGYKILDCLSVSSMNEDSSYIDYALITDTIRMLTTKSEWEIGNVLVLMPSYEEIIRLDFYILKHKLIGNLPQMISVHLLHSNIEKDQLEAIIRPKCITVVLATAVVLRMGFLQSFPYVIDTARTEYISYHIDKMCEQVSYKWVSQECIENRTKFAGRVKGRQGTYFLLISKVMFQKLTDVSEPELLTMPLDKVCLTVKLLAQHQFVAEYFQNTIVQPLFLHVHQTVERLKRMDIMDLFEDLTWLGCRIIDVPVDCQLGKLLVFAILLQCLDPILTIVSFMCCADPLHLPDNVEGPSKSYTPTVRFKIKQERKRIAEGSFSDHLMFIRLYQEWQNQLRDDSPEIALVDEHHFVLNGILESVCETRTLLVGALRSSQLIHNQGHLSMHYINLKSNCWPIIKAALVGGLYPQICVIDIFTWQIKSPKTGKIVLHPSSVLRGLSSETFKECAQSYQTPWIVYGKECPSITCNSIKCCTLVTPFSIALFAGPTKIHSTNIRKNTEPYLDTLEKNCCFIVDEWIWFIMKYTDAQLVLKTRQHFYSLYFDYLQHCGSMDKWRRTSILLIQNPHFFDTIEKVLLLEDVACGFSQPENVGIRPKAMPNKCLTALNSCISWDENVDLISNNQVSSKYQCYNAFANPHLKNVYDCGRFRYELVERQFFMVYLSESNEKVVRKYDQEWLSDSVGSVITPFLRPKVLTFVIMYHNNPDVFSAVALAKWNYGDFFLQDCFKNKIPIYELINICLKHKFCIPTFNKRRAAFQLDEKIGNIILDLFANRNNWLHNI